MMETRFLSLSQHLQSEESLRSNPLDWIRLPSVGAPRAFKAWSQCDDAVFKNGIDVALAERELWQFCPGLH
jgi:hypothetical protein